MIKRGNFLVLIPAYNESRTISEVVRKTLAFLPVVVIDDGSEDATVSLAMSAGAEVLRQQPNQGKGAALRLGFNYALSEGYDAVITLDADAQHDPAEIPSFLTAYATNPAELIIGQRNFALMPPVRRLSNTLGTLLFSWAVGQPIPDNQSGYRMINRSLLEKLTDPSENGFEFEVEMIIRCLANRFKMDWVPIRTIYGEEKSHINPLKHTGKFVQVALRARKVICAVKPARQ